MNSSRNSIIQLCGGFCMPGILQFFLMILLFYVLVWEEKRTLFHNTLIIQYKASQDPYLSFLNISMYTNNL